MGFWNLMWLVATLSSSNSLQGVSAPAPSSSAPELTQGVSPATTDTLTVAYGVSISVVSPPVALP